MSSADNGYDRKHQGKASPTSSFVMWRLQFVACSKITSNKAGNEKKNGKIRINWPQNFLNQKCTACFAGSIQIKRIASLGVARGAKGAIAPPNFYVYRLLHQVAVY